MAQIRFNVKPISDKKMHIRAIFQDGTTQKSKNIGETIPSIKAAGKYKYWDQSNEQVRTIDGAERINTKINSWKTKFSKYKDDCKRNEKTTDITLFINSLDGNINLRNPGDVLTLLSAIASFKKSIVTTHDESTYKMYSVLEHDIVDMEAHTGEIYTIADIDNGWYKKFASYLITEENNFNAIINKKQGRIVTVLKYVQDDMKLKPNPDYNKKYKLKTVKAPKFPLHPEELATLWEENTEANFEQLYTTLAALEKQYGTLEDPRRTRVRIKTHEAITAQQSKIYHQMCLDAFLLATETGMRYSDIIQLKGIHVKSHVTGSGLLYFIDVTEIKTDDGTNMPLSDKAMRIINRYTFDGKKEAPLFVFSASQAVGKVLKTVFKDKELARPCEVIKKQGAKTHREIKALHQVISFHTARNTYITRLLAAGLAPVHVKDNVGHSKLEVTMGYFRNEDITRFLATLAILNAPGIGENSQN